MSAAILCGVVLALAVCVGTARLLWQSWQAPTMPPGLAPAKRGAKTPLEAYWLFNHSV
mgnify:CR=1 FL=1